MKEAQVSEYLHDSIRQARQKLIIIFSIFCACVIAALLTATIWPVFAGIVALFIGLLCTQNVNWQSLRSGIRGERISRERLRSLGLSDKHTAYFNVPIHHAGGAVSDIDCVVAGPCGLAAMEIKHHNGIVIYRDGQWWHIKIGRGGRGYLGGLKNPSKQISGSLMKLKAIIREMTGKRIWIDGVIVFTNNNVVLDIEGLRGVRAIRPDEIHMLFHGPARYSDRDVAEINDALASYVRSLQENAALCVS